MDVKNNINPLNSHTSGINFSSRSVGGRRRQRRVRKIRTRRIRTRKNKSRKSRSRRHLSRSHKRKQRGGNNYTYSSYSTVDEQLSPSLSALASPHVASITRLYN